MPSTIESPSSPSVPDWERNLRLHTQLSIMAVRTGSHKDLHAL